MSSLDGKTIRIKGSDVVTKVRYCSIDDNGEARVVTEMSCLHEGDNSYPGAAQFVSEDNPYADFFKLAQRLAGHYLMGSGFADIETAFGTAARAIKDHWPLPPRNVLALFRPPQKMREKRLDEAVAAMDDCLLGFIAECRLRNFEGCGVLEHIAIGSRKQGDEFDDRSLRDQLLTLFFAGHETSATSLAWIHYLLSEHPDVRAKMQAEINSVIGTCLDRAVQ